MCICDLLTSQRLSRVALFVNNFYILLNILKYHLLLYGAAHIDIGQCLQGVLENNLSERHGKLDIPRVLRQSNF